MGSVLNVQVVQWYYRRRGVILQRFFFFFFFFFWVCVPNSTTSHSLSLCAENGLNVPYGESGQFEARDGYLFYPGQEGRLISLMVAIRGLAAADRAHAAFIT